MTSLLGVPIRVREAVVGDLYLTDKIGALEFSDDDQRLVELLAAHAGVAIENARLHAQVGELTARRERDRIARDLHDGIIQDIYGASLQLENAAEDVADAAVQANLIGIADQLSRVIGDIRAYIQGLPTRELAGQSLAEGLTALIEEVNGWGGVSVTWVVEGEPYQLSDLGFNTVLHIAREALANVTKHARASAATVHLRYGGDGITLTVTDDGQGFDPEAPRGEEHLGLRNLRSRAEEAGGTFTIQSKSGAGTTLGVWIPSPR
jgi:signal transduction histidine kinase